MNTHPGQLFWCVFILCMCVFEFFLCSKIIHIIDRNMGNKQIITEKGLQCSSGDPA